MKEKELNTEEITQLSECESIAEGSFFWNELRTIVEDGVMSSENERT